jgi:hypothetical protein
MRYRQRFDYLAYPENTCTISMSSSPLVASSRSILVLRGLRYGLRAGC